MSTVMKFPAKVQQSLQYLEQEVGGNGTIILFGSQLNPRKKIADYDIGVLMSDCLSWRTFSVWKTRCEELAWPYKIDLVDLGRAPENFIQSLKQSMLVLHGKWRHN